MGSINLSDIESVEESDKMLSERTHHEVLDNMFSHVKGDMSAAAVQELVKVETSMLNEGLNNIQSGLLKYKLDPQSYVSTMNMELMELVENHSHKYFSANWNLLITHESFTSHVKEKYDMQKQLIDDQKNVVGRNLHLPEGYENLELNELKQDSSLIHQRMELLIEELLRRTNKANEARRERIKSLEAELSTLEVKRESPTEASELKSELQQEQEERRQSRVYPFSQSELRAPAVATQKSMSAKPA